MPLQHWPPKPNSNGTGYSNRDRAAQARFRTAVLNQDGHQCANCGSTQDLRACHLTPLHMGGTYDLSNGLTRCSSCDIETDGYAR